MSRSTRLKKKGGNTITKAMIEEKLDQMAVMMTAMEATLMEWEIWYRFSKIQKKNLTQDQYDFYINDGPIFTDIPGRIMDSIRANMGAEPVEAPVAEKSAVLGADGLPIQQNAPKTLLDSSGNPVLP